MRYYILRTNVKDESKLNTKLINGYNFKINTLNAERLLSDAKDEDIFYLLYNIPEKKFIEQGLIKSVQSNKPSNKYEALFSDRKSLNINYPAYSTPNCGIIPTSKKKVREILNISF